MKSLEQFFDAYSHLALAFSGGVDSAYLLYAGIQCGAAIQPYFMRSVFQPQFELDDAQRLAKQLGVELRVLDVDILAIPQVAENSEERCYYCKRALLSRLQQQARADGYELLIDGSNASDNEAERPGTRALRELGVRSPLRECGLSKEQIRALSRKAGLFTWDKPAYACLATRIPCGRSITASLLQRIERAEQALYGLGFSDLRVRVYGEAARLQLPAAQLETALQQRQVIRQALQPYFETVLLDLQER